MQLFNSVGMIMPDGSYKFNIFNDLLSPQLLFIVACLFLIWMYRGSTLR